jgi:D-ribulokinase
LLADATGKPVLATRAEEPVLLGAAILGAVAGGRFTDVMTAMSAMSQVSRVYEPDRSVGASHDSRFRAFTRLQSVAREIR